MARLACAVQVLPNLDDVTSSLPATPHLVWSGITSHRSFVDDLAILTHLLIIDHVAAEVGLRCGYPRSLDLERARWRKERKSLHLLPLSA